MDGQSAVAPVAPGEVVTFRLSDLPAHVRSRVAPDAGIPARTRRHGPTSQHLDIRHGERGVTIAGLALRNLTNWRPAHWSERARYVADVRRVVAVALLGCVRPGIPARITVTRQGVRAMDDDGCVAACKPVRDEVARWLGIDDADPRVRWIVEQAHGAPAVTIAW